MKTWATGLCSAHRKPDPLCRRCNPRILELEQEKEELEAKLAVARMPADLARALTMQEAAWVALAQPYFQDTKVGKRQEWVKQEISARLRELAILPSTVRVVKHSDLEQLHQYLKRTCQALGEYCIGADADALGLIERIAK